MRVIVRLLLGLACLGALAPAAAAQDAPDSPEPAIRELVTALYAHDVAAYERLTLAHPSRAALTASGRRNDAALRELQQNPDGLQVRQQRPYLLRGAEVEPGANGRYPDGTTAFFMVAHRGGPMMLLLQRRPEGWRADVRWWAAGLAQSGAPPVRESPEFAVRAMLRAMFQIDRAGAARWLTDPRGLELLFASAPSQREPSGVYEATVEEMPLVPLGAGEFHPLPTGEMAEGGTAADRRLLVGWFGPTEIPFVVRRLNGQWRVEPQPYFAVLQ